MTIKEIMEEMEGRVIKNIPISAGSWVESALRINALVSDLDNKIAGYEAQILDIEAEFIKQDIPASKARILARNKIDYKDYLIKRAEREKITEFIRLAKKRAEINEL
jgi:hypothetical protein